MNNKFKIIVDSREQIPWTFFEDDFCSGSIVQKLDAGDYSIVGFENDFSIERKRNVAEIAGNIVEDRWGRFLDKFNQIPHNFIICEFGVDDILKYPLGSSIPKRRQKYIKIRPPFILSKIAEMQLLGINIIFAGNTENARLLSLNLMRKISQVNYGL